MAPLVTGWNEPAQRAAIERALYERLGFVPSGTSASTIRMQHRAS